MMTLFFIFFFAMCALLFIGIFLWFMHHVSHGSLTSSHKHTIDPLEQSSETTSINDKD